MAISKRVRFEVLKRDNHRCRYCGATADDMEAGMGRLTVDHVVPTSLGGTDDPSNLVAACRDCNAGKSSSNPDAPLVADVAQDALRWAAAMKLATERLAARAAARNAYGRTFEEALREYDWPNGFYAPQLPEDWQDSVEAFYKAGLPIEQLTRALDIAMSKRHVGRYDKFRYTCGICWKVVTEMQDEARRILDEEGAADGG